MSKSKTDCSMEEAYKTDLRSLPHKLDLVFELLYVASTHWESWPKTAETTKKHELFSACAKDVDKSHLVTS